MIKELGDDGVVALSLYLQRVRILAIGEKFLAVLTLIRLESVCGVEK